MQCQQDRCVSILLEHKADPNLVDFNGNTALHLAARIPSIPVALQLLEHEANINAQNKVSTQQGSLIEVSVYQHSHTNETRISSIKVTKVCLHRS